MEDNEWEYYESGPFCAHWGDFTCECSCGHHCGRHGEQEGECDECECKKFSDKEESLKDKANKAFN